MFLKAFANTPRFLGLVLLLAFVTQTIAVQAEHAGAIKCCLHEADCAQDQDNSGQQDKGSVESHSCCGHTLAIPHLPDTFNLAGGSTADSFALRNEGTPDGPIAAIDHPPQLG